MRSYTRHQLKQDAFAETTADTISWAVEHRSKLIAAAIALALIMALGLGAWAFVNYRDQQAREQLAEALQKYNAPIRPAGQPATSDMISFGSVQERAKVTNAEFTRIADKFSFTQTGHLARYFAGISLHDLGDNAGAEKQLKEVAESSRYKNIGSLAKLALASLYADSNQSPKAIEVYKQLIDHPTDAVGKSTAEFQLAELYANSDQSQEARKIYQQLQKDSPTGPVGQLAAQRLQALGGGQPGVPQQFAPPQQ